MEQALQAALEAYGMDVPATIQRFGGNENLLLKYLRRFPSDVSFAALAQAMAEEQYEAIKAACHTLKGVSGNLGLTPLYSAACDMMAVLRQNERSDVRGQYQAVLTAYEQAIALARAIGEC